MSFSSTLSEAPWGDGIDPLSLNGLRLLLADDDEDTRTLFTFVLEDYGAEVLAVGSVQAAIEAVEQQRPHLLISDINLPDADGYSLLRQVRSLDSKSSKIPVIATSGFDEDYKATDTSSEGFQCYLCKPVDPDELVAAVMSLTKREVAL